MAGWVLAGKDPCFHGKNGGKMVGNPLSMADFGRFAIMFDCQRNRPQAMKPLMEVAENSGSLGVTVRTKE